MVSVLWFLHGYLFSLITSPSAYENKPYGVSSAHSFSSSAYLENSPNSKLDKVTLEAGCLLEDA